MKICIVTPSVIKGDGQGRANYEIVWEAIRRGHNITLLASRVAPELQQNSQVKWVFISAKEWKTQLLREIVFSWQSTNWLRKHRHEFDLIQVYGAITRAKGDVNTAQFVHSAWLRSPVHISRVRRDLYGAYQWFYTVWNAYWEKKCFYQAKVVVAVSEHVKQELLSIGIQEESIRVIFNGVDLQEFFPGVADRRKLGLPEEVPLAFFAGDIHTNRKNLDTVLSALVQVPELHLVVVGTAEGTPYPHLVQSLELDRRVHFLGYRHDVAKLIQAADLFVFPSRYEPFGLVVIEAMASGVPVITATTTGASEIVTPECGVVLSDPEDVEVLAEALNNLKSDHEKRQRMGQAARSVAEQHSWRSKACSYVNLFEELSK